ncbi:MAG: hypothetical protein ABIZ34_10325, partial [Candidatus Limnocylindrales bacterium]
MDRSGRVPRWLVVWLMVASLMGVSGAPPVSAAGASLPNCGSAATSWDGPPQLVDVLDARGWLVGHRLEAAGTPGVGVSLGRIAFLDGPFGDRWVVGETTAANTRLRVLDASRGCVESNFSIAGMVFAASISPSGTVLVHDLVDATSRAELGVWRRPLNSAGDVARILPGIGSSDTVAPVWTNGFAWGPAGELAAQSCGEAACVTRIVQSDGVTRTYRSSSQGVIVAVTATSLVTSAGDCHATDPCPTVTFRRTDGARMAAADVPRVDPRPVPQYTPLTWAQDTLLGYRWASDAPNSWMRPGINAAAADVTSSRGSLAARFTYDAGSADDIQLRTEMTGNCLRSVACAHFDIPRSWYVRIRPQGTELDWGTVRWCQAYDDWPNGCYEVERVMLHEFGHVLGLAHPEDFGFRLGTLETIMTARGQEKGETGWQTHRFLPCDVARLQRRYDLVAPSTPLALCDRVETRLSLELSA